MPMRDEKFLHLVEGFDVVAAASFDNESDPKFDVFATEERLKEHVSSAILLSIDLKWLSALVKRSRNGQPSADCSSGSPQVSLKLLVRLIGSPSGLHLDAVQHTTKRTGQDLASAK